MRRLAILLFTLTFAASACGTTARLPLFEYSHSEGCSVTKWQDVYFYGNFCSGKVWGALHLARR